MLDADCQRYTIKGSEEIIVKEVKLRKSKVEWKTTVRQ